MKKQACKCGCRDFNIDRENPRRVSCVSCNQRYTWNGKEFVATKKIKAIIQEVERILGLDWKPEPVKPETYGETAADKEFKELLLREKKAARARPKKEKKPPLLSLAAPSKKRMRWAKCWRDYLAYVVEEGIVRVEDYEHVGKIRGKHILKEAHRRIKRLGYKSRINFGCSTIEFLGDREKAMDDLRELETWG